MKEISIDDFLDSIGNVKGINKDEIKKKYNSLESYEEKQEYMKKLLAQAEARYKDLKARKSKEERAARTRRLIQIGGLVESVMGREYPEEEQNALREQLYLLKDREEIFDTRTQIGEVAERILGRSFESRDIQRFQNFLLGQEHRGGYYSKAMDS